MSDVITVQISGVISRIISFFLGTKAFEKYYFNNEFECLITVSKHEKAMNLEGRSPERFIAFECFDTVIKHAERVVEIASQTKTLNK